MENKEFFKNINKIIDDYNIKGIIVGLPIQDNNIISRHSIFIEGLLKHMHREKILNIPTTFINESYSTFQAGKLLEQYQVDQKNFDRNFSHNKQVT